MKVLSVGMMFCDIPLTPVPSNILELDNAMIDKVFYHTGGDALTVSMVLAKMGVPVSIVGRIGDDFNGKYVMGELARNGVDISHVILDPEHATATSYQLIEPDGQRHFLVDAVINHVLTSRDVPDEAIEDADLVFFGSALAHAAMTDDEMSSLFRRAHALGKLTAMDASVAVKDNAVRKLDLVEKTLHDLDIFIPSYEEASYLAQKTDVQEIIEVFSRYPIKIFGIKLGGEGCILTDFKQQIRVSIYPDVKAVDTTGAGDCFMGGFLCAYGHGWDLQTCGCFATTVSSYGISSVGASTGVPNFDVVYNYMEKNKEKIIR